MERKLFVLMTLAITASLVITACGPTAAPGVEVVQETVVVQEEVEVMITPTPSPEFQELYDAVGVEAVDENTVKFTLDFGAGYWPQVASMTQLDAQPSWVIAEKGDRWIEPGFLVTNGAYVMTEWVHGDHMDLAKNPFWPLWGSEWADGNIEVVRGGTIEEASTVFALYENDELDTSDVPLEQIQRIKDDPVLSEEFVQVPINCTYFYGFITEKEPVNDVKVRQALSMGVDRVTLVEQVTQGGQIPANTFTNPLNFGAAAEDPDIAPWALTEEKGGTGYAAAVEMGKGLLEEAGFPNGDGLDILLMHNVSEGHARIAQAIQAMWSEAYPGMNVSVETQEWRVYLDTIEATTDIADVPHVYRLGWCADYPHANNWLLEVFHPDEGSNRTRMSVDDPQVGDLIAEYMEVTKQAQTAPEAEAEQLYKRAEKLLNDEIAAIIPIYYYTEVEMAKPWLERSYDPIQLHLFQWNLDWAAKQAATGAAGDVVTLDYNWDTEPPTADPSLATDTTSSNVITSIFTGLTDIDDETRAAVPALATSWESNEDKTEWTFTIRDDVPWVRYDVTTGEIVQLLDDEGNPRFVTAEDVVYGVKRTCDPNTASDYAYLLYGISGCQELNTLGQ